MKNVVIELAPFDLKSNVSEAELLSASSALQSDFLSQQKGYIRRELIKKSETSYLDIVWWESEKLASEAMKAAADSQVCYRYFQLMNADHSDPGAGVILYQLVKAY